MIITLQNSICLKSRNKQKQRKQPWETGFGEWPWPQTLHRELGEAAGDTWSFPGNHSRTRACLTQLRPLPTFTLLTHISQKVFPDGWKVGAGSSWMHLAWVPKIEVGVFSEWGWTSMSACSYLEDLAGHFEAHNGQAKRECQYMWTLRFQGSLHSGSQGSILKGPQGIWIFFSFWMVYPYFSSRHTECFPKLSMCYTIPLHVYWRY